MRMAAHAIKAGEGDVFVAAGVECVSRFGKGNSDSLPDTQNPKFDDAKRRSDKRAEGGQGAWSPPEGLPDIYIAMGQTAENVVEQEGVTRAGDGRVRRALAEPRRRLPGERFLRA